MKLHALLALLAAWGLATLAHAQTSYPMITHTSPVAVQRGRSAVVVVEGQMDFRGAYKVLFDTPVLTAKVVTPPATAKLATPSGPLRSVKIEVTVPADAPLGTREFRLASSLGISSVGQLLIVDDPVLLESGNNNLPAGANRVQTPCVVHGRIEAAEDVDYFRIQAAEGQTFTFEVFCARLQDCIHDLQKHADPIVILYDAEGRELAANDDFTFADPLVSYTFARGGDYLVQVRDSKYDGDPRWVYALAITNRPFATHVFPNAAQPGQTLEVEPVGPAHALKERMAATAPVQPGVHEVPLEFGGVRTNPVALIVSPLPQVNEIEPNDAPEQATRVALPCGINGRIGKRLDLDHYGFSAKKGQPIRFEVKARRFGTPLRSSLDSMIEVLNSKGAVLASNDDAFGKDAGLIFTPPADGDYVLCVRDLNNKGGDTWVYQLEVERSRPDFQLRCDPDKAMIGPGSSAAWYVHVDRLGGFAGPIKVDVNGLPGGVSASPLTIPPSMTQGLVVLTAAANAQLDAANVTVVGTATATFDGKEESLVRPATPNQEIYFPGGGRGRFNVAMQSVAVTDPSDILRVEVSQNRITLKPGQEVRIDVTVHRRADHDKSVSLDVLLQHLGSIAGNPLPPGVTVDTDKSKTLLGAGSKGHVVLKAAANTAPIDNVPISVLCHVSINFVVKVSYSSAPILVSVQK